MILHYLAWVLQKNMFENTQFMKSVFINTLCLVLPFTLFAQTSSFNLHYNFTTGDKYEMHINGTSDTYLTINGVSQRTTQQMNDVLTLTVTGINPNQTALVTARYNSVYVNASSNDLQTTINTDSNDTDIFTTLFKKLIGKNFTFNMATDGSITNISGLDDIINAMDESIPSSQKEDEKQALKDLINNLFGTQAFKNNFTRLFPHYTNHSINVGDSWPDNYQLGGAMGGNMTNLWKLEYGDKYGIQLSSQGSMASDPSALIDLGSGLKGNVNITGTIQGNYSVNPDSGWPTQCIQHTEIKGNYTYKAGYSKKIKSDLQVPVSMVSDMQYKLLHLH
jgi:Family of unknown function (DUF6263)